MNTSHQEIELKLANNGKGAFVIEKDDKLIAEMVIGVSGNNLTVYHTEVTDELKGQGIASKLLSTMVNYARENKLKVIPLCVYVKAQFERHLDQYMDVWNQDWHR